jgi:hypothetical protein
MIPVQEDTATRSYPLTASATAIEVEVKTRCREMGELARGPGSSPSECKDSRARVSKVV